MREASLFMVLCLMVAWSHALETRTANVDISYSESNPDFSPFDNGEGYSISGEWISDQGILLHGYLNDTEFTPSGEVSTGGEVSQWRELGLGYDYAVSSGLSLGVLWSRASVQRVSEDFDGDAFDLYARWAPLARWIMKLSVGQADVQVDDVRLFFGSEVKIFDDITWVLRLRDHSDWDLTVYEVGLGIRW